MKVKEPCEIPYEGNELTRAARCKIDCDISELKRRIQSLRTKRNELSPIHVLPPEVLSKIFVLVRHLSRPVLSEIIDLSCHQAPWIHIGHVCHHWQEVALDCPSLWSVPVFARPKLAREMIRRSKTAPLIVELPVKGIWSERTLNQVVNALAQMHRVQSIEFSLWEDSQKLEPICSSLSTPCAPLLKSLSIFLRGSNNNRISFPLDAFSDAPCLQSVDLNFFKFSWNSAIFRHGNLTSLQLRNNLLDGASTIGQMMDVLHHLPKLRILELIDAIPSHATSNGNEKVVELKFLEQLVLNAKAPDCIFLLRHMQYPSHTTVRLQSSYVTGIEDSRTIISLLGERLCRTHRTETGDPHCPVVIRSARLNLADLMICGITFFNTIDEVERPHIPFGQSDPIIQIHLLGTFAFSYGHAHLLTNIYNCFDLSSLECLVLDWNFAKDHIRAIRNTVGRLPKLERVHICSSLPEICLALQNSRDDLKRRKSQSSSLVTPFPALKTLFVEDVDFQSHEILGCLTVMLKFRARPDISAPIDRLCLKYCRVQTWQKRQLGELVASLEVNDTVVDVNGLSSDDSSGNEDTGEEEEQEQEQEQEQEEEEEEEEDHSDEDEEENESSGEEDSSDWETESEPEPSGEENGGFSNEDEEGNE